MNIPAPPGKTFLPYQEKGIRYCLGARGTILADEMGLGKTVQAIGVMNAMQAQRVFIICPKSLRQNWYDELSEWQTHRPLTLIIATYGELKTFINLKSTVEWDLLIIDEAHYIKNAQSKRSQNVKTIADKCKGRILLLTGTPIENCPVELWPLLQIACPEKWDPPTKVNPLIKQPQESKSHPGHGPYFWKFALRYCAAKKARFRMGNRFHTAWDFKGASNLDELQKELRSTCMVRRLKKDVLPELPEKRRKLIHLKGKHGKSVEDSAAGIMERLGVRDITEENYDNVVRRLRSDKVLFEEYSIKRHEQALEKADECIEIIEDALDGGGKLVVFGYHTDVLEKIYKALDFSNPGIAVLYTGQTSEEDRNRAVKRFQENEVTCRVFIGSIGAAGVGITLTASSHVIFVELEPVPGRMSQAEDRLHRIGQKNMVLIWHLLADGSICARMAKILVKKQAVISAALDGNEQSQDW